MSIYLQNPPEDKKYKFVLQVHTRGRSVHLDFRYELEPKTILLGWTIDEIKSLSKTPESLAEAKKFAETKMPAFIKKCHDPKTKWVVQTKAKEPYNWLFIDDQEFKPGTVGATKNEFGYMWIIDNGTVEYGAQKISSNELFCHGTKKWNKQTIWDGRLIVRALPNVWKKKSLATGEESKTGKGYLVHMAFFADDLTPYAIDTRALKKEWYPPAEISALPKKVRSQIPSEFQYWKIKEQKKAHEIRDELIKGIKEKDVVLEYAEKDYFAARGHLSYLRKDEQEKDKKKKEEKQENGLIYPELPEGLTVDKIKVPSSSVHKKIKETLFYDPPKDLRFYWDPGPGTYAGKTKKGEILKQHCPDCLWMASKSPYTIDTLPTYPGEKKIMCQGKDHPRLSVEFPGERKGEGKEYTILPVRDKKLFKSKWILDAITDDWVKDVKDVKVKSMWGALHTELEKYKDVLKSLVTDAANMDVIDKAFMLFAGQPIIKDFAVAYEQAVREVLRAEDMSVMELLALKAKSKLKPAEKDPILEKIDAVALRLLNEGQILEVEEQLSGMKNFILETVTSAGVTPVTRFFFKKR